MEEEKEQKKTSSGRPPYYGEPMKQTAIWLPAEHIAWLDTQGNKSEAIRKLIQAAIDAPK